MSLKHGSYQNSIKHYIFLDIPHVLSSKNKKKKKPCHSSSVPFIEVKFSLKLLSHVFTFTDLPELCFSTQPSLLLTFLQLLKGCLSKS